MTSPAAVERPFLPAVAPHDAHPVQSSAEQLALVAVQGAATGAPQRSIPQAVAEMLQQLPALAETALEALLDLPEAAALEVLREHLPLSAAGRSDLSTSIFTAARQRLHAAQSPPQLGEQLGSSLAFAVDGSLSLGFHAGSTAAPEALPALTGGGPSMEAARSLERGPVLWGSLASSPVGAKGVGMGPMKGMAAIGMGPMGSMGAKGAMGPMGSMGCMGNMGHWGPMGFKGGMGPMGGMPMCGKGPMGRMGQKGCMATMGQKGCMGPMGQKGCMGPMGNMALMGGGGGVAGGMAGGMGGVGNMACGMGGMGCGMNSMGCAMGVKGGCKDAAALDPMGARELVLQQLDQLPPLTDSTRQAMMELPAQEALAILDRLRHKGDTVRNVSSYLYKAATNFFQGIGPRQLAPMPGGPPVPKASFRSWEGEIPDLQPAPDVPNSFQGVAPPGCSPQASNPGPAPTELQPLAS